MTLAGQAATIACIALEELRFARQQTNSFIFEDGDPDKKIVDRSIWVRPSQTDSLWQTFEKDLVWGEEWHQNFRMSKDYFYHLLSLIEDRIRKQDTHFRMAIPPAKRLAIALHYFHDEGRMRVTSKFFGVGKSSLS